MRFNKLGSSDIEVSAICLGTMTFGEQNTEEEGHEQLSYAISQGINFIDTAEMYAVPGRQQTQGATERIIGTWLKKNGNRKDLIIATKVTGPSAGLKYISDNLGFSKARILEAIEGSFKRLQVDYIDLYQLHWPERKTNFFSKLGYGPHDAEWQDNFEESIETLQLLKDKGWIRQWGLSNETPWGIMRTCGIADKSKMNRPVSIQNPYSLLNRTFEVGLSEISIREHIGLLAYSPMAFGLLSGKYHLKQDTPQDRINQFPQMQRYNEKRSWEATQAYMAIAAQAGISPATLALAFVNSREFVTSNIIGATSMQQLKENIASISITLSEETLRAVDAIHESNPNPAP